MYMGTEMGLSKIDISVLGIGEFLDLLQVHKRMYNMKTTKSTYILNEERKIADISEI